jgi:hypothetical protein
LISILRQRRYPSVGSNEYNEEEVL